MPTLPKGSFALMAAQKRYDELRTATGAMLAGWVTCFAASIIIFLCDLLGRMGLLNINVDYSWGWALTISVVLQILGHWGKAAWRGLLPRRDEALRNWQQLVGLRQRENAW